LRTYVEELRKELAVYPGVRAYRRKTDPVPNAPPCPPFLPRWHHLPLINAKLEPTMEASSSDEDGPSQMKAS
jgi:hypothetical protein